MSFNRLGFALVIFVYLLTAGASVADEQLPNLFYWSCLAVGVFVHIRLRPGHSRLRRGFALLLDMGFLTWFLHEAGEVAAPFFLVYIWVALGNGFRFGTAWLLAAMAVFVAGFGWVVLTTPYWREQPYLSAGLLIGPCVLGLYAATLIRKLSQAKRQAEQASEAKSLFLASVSHELRTPLNAIIGMGSLLRSSTLDREQQEMARTIDGGARSLLSLINRILNFSRIEAGGTTTRTEAFDLTVLLEEVRQMLLAQAREKGLRLSLHVTPRTPARILCDRTHLRDILLNLAGNAVKFTESGGVTIGVDATEPASGQLRLRFEVADTGIGIRPQALGRIFERFTQADESIASRFGGTGLGLSICKGLVRLLGGEIGVASEPGQGSTFWFTAQAARQAEQPAAAERSFAGIAAFILTSDPAGAAGIGTRLAARGAAVRSYGMSRAALAEIRGAEPDGGVPAHLVLCLPQGRDLGPGEVMEVLRGQDDHPLFAFGEAPAEGLPSPGIRRRVTTWLRAEPTEAELRTLMAIIAARLLPELDAAAARPLPASGGARRLRVLVADDNRVNRRVVQKILERSGHEALLVSDGEEALDALEEGQFDAVLMDVNMPVLGGIEATKLYRFAALGRPHVPIIGFTADATPEAAQRCREAGMDACLTKPVEPAQLIEALAAVAPQPGDTAPAAKGQEVASIASHPRFRPAPLPPLDPQVLADLEALGGSEFVAGLAEDFLREAAQVLQALQAAAGKGDVRRFRAEAHALRSSAANMGAKLVYELCGAAEAIAPAEVATAGARQVVLLAAELERVREARPGLEPRPGRIH
ncbi:hybrid sensor histidine kinase/response regulator [Siccirubricoccus sp. G192]|uniref:hybrid sensor histidine kinase/response regulator n=1 Tax=Siccirubricoccus sp. G192 TaxID=2849651 RepID=UPI001C2C2FB3|nr:hybrid sensor histidine kinase/response regulator [Siccirubricoccus sp. G192]MBV1799445.1 response regulator [Siccirubricoccus sp. G192]